MKLQLLGNKTLDIHFHGTHIELQLTWIYPANLFTENPIEMKQILESDYGVLMDDLTHIKKEINQSEELFTYYYLPYKCKHFEDDKLISVCGKMAFTPTEINLILENLALHQTEKQPVTLAA